MAKSSNSRSRYNLQTYKAEGPGVDVEPMVLWRPPRGINAIAGASYVPPEYCRFITNIMFDRGKLKSRLGTEGVGEFPNPSIMAVFSYTAPGGESALLRVLTNSVEVYNGVEWTTIFGGLGGGVTDYITWTGWGDTVLICNGATRIFFYNIVTGETGQLLESPPAKHITSFGNRVIASAITKGAFRGNVIAWCVKNNDEDWTSEDTTDGLGAGFEDMLGSPEGHVDEVMGVYPITDEVALVVREFSVWQMSLTGDFNAPFRFSRITAKVGARVRRSIVTTPYGVVFVSRNDILLATTQGVESIAETVRDRMFGTTRSNFLTMVGEYDPVRQEYRVAMGNQTWRYSFLDKGWTRDAYGYHIRHMSFVTYDALGITWDSVDEPWDDQSLTWDEMKIQQSDEAMHFVDIEHNMIKRERGIIVGEEDDPSPPPIDDSGVAVPIAIESGVLRSGSHLDRTMVIELQLEYIADIAQTLIFEYSSDNASWEEYQQVQVAITTEVTLLRVRKTLDRKNMAFRIRSPDLGRLTIFSFTPMLVKGGRMNW